MTKTLPFLLLVYVYEKDVLSETAVFVDKTSRQVTLFMPLEHVVYRTGLGGV